MSVTISIESALKKLYGSDCRIETSAPLSGGDINKASRLTLNTGHAVFLKENKPSLEAMFSAEAAGLQALAEVNLKSGSPPVPKPLAWGRGENSSYLLMDLVPGGRIESGEQFGVSLAELHRNGRSSYCGLEQDNWIGSTPQINKKTENWIDFFTEHRLLYQWKLARRGGYGSAHDEKNFLTVTKRLPEILPDVDDSQSSLLHGDLWGGNWMPGADGQGWLIDPAVYYGHREADIAMTELFGGFPPRFHEGYNAAWPLEPGFSARKDVYNLYHLLNHLNLFGSSYWGGVRAIISRFC